MNKVDYDWVKGQLTLARAQVKVGNSILELLKTWENLVELNPASAEKVLEMFSALAQNHAVVEPESEGVWVPAMGGQLIVGDKVRVKKDAFTGDIGKKHNGRLGRVVAVRTGRVVFRSTDAIEPLIDGVHFMPDDLEKRVK